MSMELNPNYARNKQESWQELKVSSTKIKTTITTTRIESNIPAKDKKMKVWSYEIVGIDVELPKHKHIPNTRCDNPNNTNKT